MSDIQAGPLRAFAETVRHERVNLTERWMSAVFGDDDLNEGDKLTYEQLADHLPSILDEICVALENEDLDRVEPAIERNARMHGKMRWRQGYRIDELARELELFRQVLVGSLAQFAETHVRFTRRNEERARHYIDEALSFVTLTSIREVVTERDRKIDEYTGRLERANHELELKQRLVGDLYESRMQITRSVVHDLRNFLNVFSMALQLVARAPARTEAALALANRQAADMKALVDELVEYSVVLRDGDSVSAEQFALRDLFDELVASCRPLIEAKGLTLTLSFDETLPLVTTNRLKLKQVAFNLLTNAAKYTKAGEIRLAMSSDGDDHWKLCVADTGIGIGQDDKERVFREFERVAGNDVPGAGLGLAIVKELSRLLGGTIHFESHEGDGTTFEIRFPVELHPEK
jgi:signal transduction histidine kinase